MRNLQFRELSLAPVSLIIAAGVTLTACSSSSSSSSPSPSPSSASSQPASSSAPATGASEPTSGAGATAAIEANWVAFFNAKTPVARRIALLQNGSVFAPIIQAQAGSTLAQLASAKVNKVTLTGTDQAGVVYSILASGTVALPNQNGVAVYQDGIWKVGDTSFCSLLKLEQLPHLPAACSG